MLILTHVRNRVNREVGSVLISNFAGSGDPAYIITRFVGRVPPRGEIRTLPGNWHLNMVAVLQVYNLQLWPVVAEPTLLLLHWHALPDERG
jgi:hypothetical protein